MANAVYWIERATGTARVAGEEELPDLLTRDDGWVWLDIPEADDGTGALLTDVFGIHPKAVADGLQRNHVSRLHHYQDTLYVVLHRPEPSASGHVHYLELDQYVGPHFLITLHGPRSPVVSLEAMVRETDKIAVRLTAGRLRPRTPVALFYSVISAITNVEEGIVNEFAQEVGQLEQRVMAQADDHHPQEFLDELFTARHTLLTVRTMAGQSAEVLARAVTLSVEMTKSDLRLLKDLRDQYLRLGQITKSQLEFLEGVTDFYRARNDTRLTIAGERLAVIAAITLPVTAISSVMGMNVIVNNGTHWVALWILLSVMAGMSIWLLRWARKQGWW